jgi:hypothetical protein
MSLGIALTGNGGVTPAVPGFINHAFWYLDNTGGVPFSKLAPYGLTDPTFNGVLTGGCTVGSLALSSSFALSTGQTLKVALSFLTADAPHYDTGMCFLLANGQVQAIMFSGYGGSEGQNAINVVPVSAGVTLTPAIAYFQSNHVTLLGGGGYGPTRLDRSSGLQIPGGSTPWVTASYAPGAGDYQLLFIAYNTVDDVIPSALAIASAQPVGFACPGGPPLPAPPTNLRASV